MNAEMLEEIETKIAFLEHANAELSGCRISPATRDIEALRDQIAALGTRIQALRESDVTLFCGRR